MSSKPSIRGMPRSAMSTFARLRASFSSASVPESAVVTVAPVVSGFRARAPAHPVVIHDQDMNAVQFRNRWHPAVAAGSTTWRLLIRRNRIVARSSRESSIPNVDPRPGPHCAPRCARPAARRGAGGSPGQGPARRVGDGPRVRLGPKRSNRCGRNSGNADAVVG